MDTTKPNKEIPKEELKGKLDSIRAMRDEIRVQIHLASLEVKQRWAGLEKRVQDLENLGLRADNAWQHLVDDTLEALRDFRKSLKRPS